MLGSLGPSPPVAAWRSPSLTMGTEIRSQQCWGRSLPGRRSPPFQLYGNLKS
ncbi:MAG: hypothetical protein ACRC8Y_27380 [Chroococcales cyanobacterium]